MIPTQYIAGQRMRKLTLMTGLSLIAGCMGEKNEHWSESKKAGQEQEYMLPNGNSVAARDHTVSDNHGFTLADSQLSPGKTVAEIYTGKALVIDDACFSWNTTALQKSYKHLGHLLQQATLLSLYAPEGQAYAWHQGAIKSLEETQTEGVHRPTTAVIEQAVRRLGQGASNPNAWVLNGVRFRVREKPMQIKINYELDMHKVAPDKSIASASIIHSIAIPEALEAEFLKALRGIPQDQTKSGCYVYRLLGYFLQKGSYFFWHANIFDTKSDINEWRFTEAKVVANDFTENAVVAGPYDIVPGAAKAGDVLRIVRMSFPYYTSDAAGNLTKTNDPPLLLWFSGNKTDLNTKPGYNLLKNVAPTDDLHLGRKHDAAFTCGQCHIRRAGATVDQATGKLTRVPSMVVRHIGFGDGGNCEKEPMFGFPRAYNRASLSSYLLEDAEAREFYGYSMSNTRPYITPSECLQPRLDVSSVTETACNFDGSYWNKKLRFTVTNRNLRPIPIGSIYTQDYGSVSANTCSNQTIGIDESCQFSMNYSYVGATSNVSGSIEINSESFSAFNLTNAHGNNACVPPTKVDADVEIVETVLQACNYDSDPSYTSKKLRYTITNNDDHALHLQDIYSNEYGSITNNTCSNNQMQAGATCSFDIHYSYTPTSNTTNMPLSHNSPYYNALAITTAHGDNSCPTLQKTNPDVSISSSVIAACQNNGGYNTKTLRFTITNNDDYALNISSNGIYDQSDYTSATNDSCSDQAMIPGASCSFDLTYSYAPTTNSTNISVPLSSQRFNNITIGTATGDNSCPN